MRHATRYYQAEAVAAAWSALDARPHEGAVCVLPTGAGKTRVIAQMVDDVCLTMGGRVLMLAHVKELLEQIEAAAVLAVGGQSTVGVYSAGLGRRESKASAVVAGVQSVWNKIETFGRFDLIAIDECHLVNTEDAGMYRALLKAARLVNPAVRLCGYTATPYRLKSGLICSPEGPFHAICYEAELRDLIAGGYLCPLVSRCGSEAVADSALTVSGGEFTIASQEAAFLEVVEAACAEFDRRSAARKSRLVFCPGVKHAARVAFLLAGECVHGETPAHVRAKAVERFKSGALRTLVNCGVYTTGFDAPNVDCVGLMRATQSPGLYCQMVGRGLRLHAGKSDCLVLDFGGNVQRHGPLDELSKRIKSKAAGNEPGAAPVRACPQCSLFVHASLRTCPDCGHEFPEPERKIAATASPLPVIGKAPAQFDAVKVEAWDAWEHSSRSSGKRSLCVEYRFGFDSQRVYVCLEHDGYARAKAAAWWKLHSHAPLPLTVAEACRIFDAGGCGRPAEIRIKSVPGEKFREVVGFRFAEPLPPVPEYEPADDDDHRAEAARAEWSEALSAFPDLGMAAAESNEIPF